MNKTRKKIVLKSNLKALCKAKGIRSATAFAKELKGYGIEISSSHASRYFKDEMPATSMDFLAATCSILECKVGDLFEQREVPCKIGKDKDDQPSSDPEGNDSESGPITMGKGLFFGYKSMFGH